MLVLRGFSFLGRSGLMAFLMVGSEGVLCSIIDCTEI